MIQAEYFLSKKGINSSDIKYIIRENGKTSVYLKDDRSMETYIPVKSFLKLLPKSDFININKGILLSKSYIKFVNKCIYVTADGRSFEGRHRALKEHLKNEIELSLPEKTTSEAGKVGIRARFSVLNKMPIAFCVMELITDNTGKAADFVFRYCNEHMAVLENASVEKLLDSSLCKLNRTGIGTRFISYADVALNGTEKVLHDYIPEMGRGFDIYCFQPERGYCACALIESRI